MRLKMLGTRIFPAFRKGVWRRIGSPAESKMKRRTQPLQRAVNEQWQPSPRKSAKHRYLSPQKMSLFLNLRFACAEGFAFLALWAGRSDARDICKASAKHFGLLTKLERAERVSSATFSNDARASAWDRRRSFKKRMQKPVCKSLILHGRLSGRNSGQETNDFRTQRRKICRRLSLFT
jgi:hypothetical protein